MEIKSNLNNLVGLSSRYQKISNYGDPLERLNIVMDWTIFSPLIKIAFRKQRKSDAGRKPYIGNMIDASIVEVPKQRNTKDINKRIKDGEGALLHNQ